MGSIILLTANKLAKRGFIHTIFFGEDSSRFAYTFLGSYPLMPERALCFGKKICLSGFSATSGSGLAGAGYGGYIFLGKAFEFSGRSKEAIENLKIAEKVGEEMGTGNWLNRTEEALARLK